MIYLNKYEQLEYWLYTATDNVYSCEETGDGLVWYDGNSWILESENLCEKLTKARAEALARTPKRVVVEGGEIYNYRQFNIGNHIGFEDKKTVGDHICRVIQDFPAGTLVKVIIEEVVE